MHVKRTKNGFVSIIQNGIVDRIECSYGESCTIYFYHIPPKKINIALSSFNLQYGIPVSDDGRTLFISSWEDGISAYDTLSGSIRWRLKIKKATSIIVYSAYVVLQKQGESLIKIDIENGTVLDTLRSGTIQRQFELLNPYILVDSIRARLSVVDTDRMCVVKQYGRDIVNPRKCLSLLIQNAMLQEGTVSIQGIEQYPDGDHTKDRQYEFYRVIDSNFLG